MAENYTVKQGDHLSKIAKAFGFSDYHTIWDHPENADLKKKRQNPNVLLPGDTVFIPDRQVRQESRSTDQAHRFTARGRTLKLRVTLEDLYEKPIAGARCVLSLEGDIRRFTTDEAGRFEQVIDPEVRTAYLSILDDQTPYHDAQIAIKIGDLDPVEAMSGQIGRLNNLGYFAGDCDQPDPAAFQSAVEEFQCDHGLQVDGNCGPITQAKLKQVHGS